ncbi:Gfo/Idh/MocA family oxidoreductase [Candidatus Latescibacterota bacterium]
MPQKSSRRSFLGKTAVVGGAALTGARKAGAQARRPTTELIRIGFSCVANNSHMGLWGSTINVQDFNNWPGRTTEMIITHCWDRDYKAAQKIAKQYQCEAVKNYDDMVGKIDAMIFGGFHEAKWWEQLTRPYLEAGIPCYIDRPLGYSMKTAKKIVDTSKKYNAPILVCDGHWIHEHAKIARKLVEKYRREGKTVIGSTGYNFIWKDFAQHGIHGLYYLLTVFGLDVESISLLTDGFWREITPTNQKIPTYMNLTLKYNRLKVEGVDDQTFPFLATQLQGQDEHSFVNSRIYYTSDLNGWRGEGEWTDIDNRKCDYTPMDRRYYLNFPTVLYMQRMIKTGKMPFSYDEMLRRNKIFLAAFKSFLEHNGGMYPVDDLPDDWEAPTTYPDWIDESIFG